jgi:hypothetical protein
LKKLKIDEIVKTNGLFFGFADKKFAILLDCKIFLFPKEF